MDTKDLSLINELFSRIFKLPQKNDKGTRELEEVRRFLSEEVTYDYDAITYDRNGEVVGVKDRTPDEVAKDRKASCMGGVFYAARKLRNYFGEEMISMSPLVQRRDRKGRFSKIRRGLAHGMYLFNTNGLYGAISVSREPLLRYIPPVHPHLESLVISEEILRGYNRLAKLRREIFLGILFSREKIRDVFPYYDCNTKPNDEFRKKVKIKMIKFSNGKRKSPEFRKYLEKVLALD